MARIANIMPPIGLCSLASWVESKGHRADIHDCYAHPGDDHRIDHYLRTESPQFVGFTTTTSSFPDAVRIAAHIKKNYPRIKTIFGGVHLSAVPERIMREYRQIDYGVVGEGEEPLLAIMESNGAALDGVPGVLYRNAGEVVVNDLAKTRFDLDTLPFPAYEKLHGFPNEYPLPIFNYPKAPGTSVVSSRGCYYQCSYCDRSVFGQSFRYNSPDYMIDLMRYLKKRFRIRHVNFYDDLFTFKRKRVETFCQKLAAADLKMTYNCAARAEHIDRDLLRLLKQSGCWMVSLGIETGDPELLSRHRSCADLEMIRERIHWIRQAGLRVKGLFMMGLPGETEKSIDRSLKYVLSLPLSDFNLAKFTPFPGSPAYETIREHGEFDETWELMNCLNFVFVPHGFTKDQLDEHYRNFYTQYFRRPLLLASYLTMLWQSPDSWIRFVKNFRDFWAVKRAYAAKRA